MIKRTNSEITEDSINKVIERDLAEQELKEIAGLFAQLDEDGDQILSLSEVEGLLVGLGYLSEKDVKEVIRPYNEWTLEKILNLLRTISFNDDSDHSPEPLDSSSSAEIHRLSSSSSTSSTSRSPHSSSSSFTPPHLIHSSSTPLPHTHSLPHSPRGHLSSSSPSFEYGQISVNPEHEKLIRNLHTDIFQNKNFENHHLYFHSPDGIELVTPNGTMHRNLDDLKKQLSNVVKSEFNFSDFRSVGNELFFRSQWNGLRDDGTTFSYDQFNKWVIADDGKVQTIMKAGSGFKIEGGLSSWLAKRRKRELELQKKRSKEIQKEKAMSEKLKEKEKEKEKKLTKKGSSSSCPFTREKERKEKERKEKAKRDDERALEKEGQKTTDCQWLEISKYLAKEKLRDIKTLPHLLTPPSNLNLICPAFGDKPQQVKKINVLKRFNSRKIPHLISIENTAGDTVKFIYKQDDDISTDVAVMKLLEMANAIWTERRSVARIRTYNVVACPDLTGFVEVVPGSTMLKTDTDAICNACGDLPAHWESFYSSLIAVVVVTCAFDITDRHHNNVMFTPDCDISLIDLSASLGKQAPLDAALKMNPVYFPKRFRKVLDYYFMMKQMYEFTNYQKDWADMEEDAMTAYFQIHNSREIRNHLMDVHNYQMPSPDKFMHHLKMRQFDVQKREITRNIIVETMDSNATINKIVAGITSIVPLN